MTFSIDDETPENLSKDPSVTAAEAIDDDIYRPTTTRKIAGQEYSNVFTIDDADLGDIESLLIPDIHSEKRRCIRTWVVYPLCVLSLTVFFTTGVLFVLYSYPDSGVTTGSIMSPPADLGRKCNSTALRTLSGWEGCRDVCIGGECCIKPVTDRYSCLQGHPTECKTYFQHCNPVYFSSFEGEDDDLNTEDKMFSVKRACSSEKISSGEGWDACLDLCMERSCCFFAGPKSDCSLTEPDWCGEYSPCQLLLEQKEPQSLADAALVDRTCSYTNILEETGRENCQQLCTQRACCFLGDAFSCYEKEREWCDEYKACLRLYSSSKTNPIPHPEPLPRAKTTPSPSPQPVPTVPPTVKTNPPSQPQPPVPIPQPPTPSPSQKQPEPNSPQSISIPPVEEACSPDAVSTFQGKETCATLCMERSCCFEIGSENCYSQRKQWCDEYGACKILIGGAVDYSCSREKVSTKEGKEACERICESRKCCFAAPGSIDNCYSLQKEWCDEYSACKKVFDIQEGTSNAMNQTTTETTHATDMVDVLCADEKINTDTGRLQCRNFCGNRSCCFSSSENCYSLQKEWCDEYNACKKVFHIQEVGTNQTSNATNQTTNATTQKGNATTQEIKITPQEACTPDAISTPQGKETCATLCMERSCCFSDENNCSSRKPEWCEEYSPCKILYGGSVEEACTDATEEGREHCASLCMKRKCCFMEGEDSCYSLQPAWCDEYKACEAVFGSPVEDACSFDKLSTKEGRVECEKLCGARSCCFAGEDSTENCYSLQKEWCDEYSACKILTADTVDTACMEENVATFEGSEQCKDFCLSRECCFQSGPGNCSIQKKEWCEEYSACKILYNDTVDALCTDEKIFTKEGRTDCTNLCQSRSCCFLTGSDTCYPQKQSWCDEYQACKKVLNVDEACTDDRISSNKGRENCASLCLERECCFASNDNCFEQKKEWCDEYSACKVLYREPVDDACEPEKVATEREECEKLCAKRSCCFAAPQSGDNCYSLEPEWCDEYNACKILNSTVDSANHTADDLCTLEKISTEQGRLQCQNICQSRSCCFLPGSDNCYSNRRTWCDEYQACKKIYVEEEPLDLDEDIAVELYNACSEEMLSSEEGRQACRSKCVERDCCVVPENCQTDPVWCGDPSPCAKLTQVEITPVSDTTNNNATHENHDSQIDTNKTPQNSQIPGTDTNKTTTDSHIPGNKTNAPLSNSVTTFVKTACENMLSSSEDRTRCETQCTERYCCYLENLSCYEENADWCNAYPLCDGIYSSKNVVGKLMHHEDVGTYGRLVEEGCENKFDGDEVQQCVRGCKERFCCSLQGPLSCYASNSEWCDAYQVCMHLNETTQQDDFAQSATESLFTAVCGGEAISNQNNYARCGVLCASRKCCFESTDKSCYDEKKIWCDEFDLCRNMDVNDIPDSKDVLDILDSTCSIPNLISGLRPICEHLCEERACCFSSPEDNCYETSKEWCDEFGACENLSLSEKDMVGEYCTPSTVKTDEGRDICSMLCETRSCCFADTDNCYDEEKERCDEFELCINLTPDEATTLVDNEMEDDVAEEGQFDINNICSRESLIDDEGRLQCEELCSSRSCCFSTQHDNCYLGSQEWCDEYKACKNLEVPEGVDNVCSEDNLRNEKGRIACRGICSERACCFSTGHDNCYLGSQEWCDEYKACKNLDL